MRFEGHLGQCRFGDVVVAPPVRGALGVSELVEEVPIQLPCQPGRDIGDGRRVIDEVAASALALNERDYGDLSGLNKDDARKRWGEEQVHIWRRSYDVPPPGGESLKDTLARALPYYVQEILPGVLRGERTLVAAHGNSLRALIMVLEKLSPEGILKRELATGVPIIYRLNADSTVASKLDLAA